MLQVVLGELLPKTVGLALSGNSGSGDVVADKKNQPADLQAVDFRLQTVPAFALMRCSALNTEHGHMHVHSPDELEGLYRESAAGGLIDADERNMLAGALGLKAPAWSVKSSPRAPPA